MKVSDPKSRKLTKKLKKITLKVLTVPLDPAMERKVTRRIRSQTQSVLLSEIKYEV